MDRKKVEYLDTVTSEACPKCGSKGWIVDGPYLRSPNAWLLCLDVNNAGCVETKPLDPDLQLVIEV